MAILRAVWLSNLVLIFALSTPMSPASTRPRRTRYAKSNWCWTSRKPSFRGTILREPSPDTASFRAMTKMLSGQRDMALETGAIAFHINNWLESKFELPPTDLPDLSNEPTPEVAADSLRRYWGIGEMPIRNMIHLLEAKGVRVYSLAIDAREVDAFSAWKGSTPFVFLNTNKSSEHSRYDAAHELGHLILHRQGSPQGREAERQANLFAGAFLMPRASVLAHARPFPTLSRLIELKKIWIISLAALNYRLHEVGLTSDWVYRGLCIEIAKRGYRTKEPNGAPREVSQALLLMLAALRQDGIGRHKMAEALSFLHRIGSIVVRSCHDSDRRWQT